MGGCLSRGGTLHYSEMDALNWRATLTTNMPRDEASSQPDACRAPSTFSPPRFAFFTVVFLVMMGSGVSIFFLVDRAYGIQLASLVCYTAAVILFAFSANRGMHRFLFDCPFVRPQLPRLARWLSRCPSCPPDGSPPSSPGSVPFLVRPHRPQRQFTLRTCPVYPLCWPSSHRDRQYPLYPRTRAPSSAPTDPSTRLARVISSG